ncbi:hypothetical protein DYI21_12265 [Thalassospira tepidiphila]|jgi:C4-dicarboxylate transporter, DctM subunit|nr:hypothetical protein [Thalassospira tepidiphila]
MSATRTTCMIVLTSSVALPMIQSAGLDPIWFGIYLVLVVEMSQITPPVGFNLFVLQSISGRDILTVTKASLPFFFLLLFGLILITIWPEIATFLPGLTINR